MCNLTFNFSFEQLIQIKNTDNLLEEALQTKMYSTGQEGILVVFLTIFPCPVIIATGS